MKSTSPGSGASLRASIGAVASPVREAEDPLSQRRPRRAIAKRGDHSGQVVPRDRRCSVTIEAIGPGRGPRQLIPGESRRMNLNDDVIYRCLRLGPLHQLHPGRSRAWSVTTIALMGIISSVIWLFGGMLQGWKARRASASPQLTPPRPLLFGSTCPRSCLPRGCEPPCRRSV